MSQLIRIGVDFDDVVFDFNNTALAALNTISGTNVTYEDLHSHYLPDVFGKPIEVLQKTVLDFYQSEEHMTALPIPGSIEALRRLSGTYSLHIITSRPTHTKNVTIDWIDANCPEVFTDLHFTNQFAPDAKFEVRKKSQICKALGVRTLIEDALHNAEEVANAGLPVLLPVRPWNRSDTLPERIFEKHHWNEIEDWIRQNIPPST